MSEVKILELRIDGRTIQLTNEYLRFAEWLPMDRGMRRMGIVRERYFAREEYQLHWDLEIPIKKIIKMDYENGKLKILWMKSGKEGYEKPEEYEVKLTDYQATQIIEAYSRVRKGEDPIVLAKEYVESFIGYIESIDKGDIVVSIEGEYIKIESGEFNRILSYRYMFPYVASLFSRISDVYAERIPIKDIVDVNIESIDVKGVKENRVKIILKNGKVKYINFYDEEEKAVKFVNVLKKILFISTKKKEERIKYEIKYKTDEVEKVKAVFTASDLRSILIPALIIFLILATLTIEYIGRDVATIILVFTLSLILGAIWRKIRST